MVEWDQVTLVVSFLELSRLAQKLDGEVVRRAEQIDHNADARRRADASGP